MNTPPIQSHSHFALAGVSIRCIVLAVTLGLSGCANWKEDGGVANHWRADTVPQWVEGETREQDVMAALGPPSQIVNLNDRIVYYYLHENVEGSGYYFLVYNQSHQVTRYDRAIFFFDSEGVLLKFAYSQEALSYEE